MPRAAKPDFHEALCRTCGSGPSLRAAIGEHVGGWKHRLQITDLARFINSEIALPCDWQGTATHKDLLAGSEGTHQETARPLEGGFAGRTQHLPQRAALEPLNRSSSDRRVGLGPSTSRSRDHTKEGRRPRLRRLRRSPVTHPPAACAGSDDPQRDYGGVVLGSVG
jgi:hypothetical protein